MIPVTPLPSIIQSLRITTVTAQFIIYSIKLPVKERFLNKDLFILNVLQQYNLYLQIAQYVQVTASGVM